VRRRWSTTGPVSRHSIGFVHPIGAVSTNTSQGLQKLQASNEGAVMAGSTNSSSTVPARFRLGALFAVSAVVALLALGGCGKDEKKSSGTAAEATGTSGAAALSGAAPVQILNFEFKPQKVTVKPGTKVTWTNGDTATHAIKDTSPLATPVSKDMGKGDMFSITYDKAGSYSYICGIHNYMTGTVDVVG
jgi:plastocyanin